MATNEDATSKRQSKKPAEKKSARTSNTVKPFINNPLFIASALVIAITALCFALFATYSFLKLNQQLTHHASLTQSELTTFNQTYADLNDRLKTLSQSSKTAEQQLEAKLESLHQAVQSGLQKQRYQSDDWALLTARYYLQLAQINAHWSDDLQATTALLKQADELLSNLHDPRLFKVREAIADELVQIKTMPRIDVTGLLSQLNALKPVVDAMALKKSVVSQPSQAVNDEMQDKAQLTWNERLKNSVHLLERLVIVRRHGENITPLLTAAQESMLRESIQINIQAASLAVLQRNDAAYTTALNQATQVIKRYFTTNKGLMDKLNQLKKKTITQQKPDLTQSYTLLKQLIETNPPQPTESATTGENS